MELSSYGDSDIFLTGSPSISHFNKSYKKHTNFAKETVEVNFETDFETGVDMVAIAPRVGDLLCGVYLKATLPDIFEKNLASEIISEDGYLAPHKRYVRWIDNVGHYLINYVTVEIGDTVIDRLYGDWLEIWSQLSLPAEKEDGYRYMIGQDKKNVLLKNTGLQKDVLKVNTTLIPDQNIYKERIIKGRDIFIPLPFWFCKDYGNSLPIISLGHTDVRFTVNLRREEDMIISYEGDKGEKKWTAAEDMNKLVGTGIISASLMLDYIFLEKFEQEKFLHSSHEYLIEQLQVEDHSVVSGSFNRIEMDFKHPVKELVWVVKQEVNNREWNNYTDTRITHAPPLQTLVLSLENQDIEIIEGMHGLPIDTDFLQEGQITFTWNNLEDIEGLDVEFSFVSLFDTDITEHNGDPVTSYINVDGYPHLNTSDIILISNSGGDIYRLMVIEYGPGVGYELGALDNIPVGMYDKVVGVIKSGIGIISDNSNDDQLPLLGMELIDEKYDLHGFKGFELQVPENSEGRAKNPVDKCAIYLNNVLRVRDDGSYFNKYQPYKHHSRMPRSPGINVYSFALNPEDSQPSGTCNFSALDYCRMDIDIRDFYGSGVESGEILDKQPCTLRIYACNTNILRIRGGKAVLAYN